MKRLLVLVPVILLIAGPLAYGTGGGHNHPNPGATNVTVDNQVQTNQNQHVSVIGGGDADATSISHGGSADSSSSSKSSISTSSVSNYQARTQPLDVFPAYLPYWNHGGWGTVKGYFPNRPSLDDAVYEQTFDPNNPEDMRMLKGVLTSLSYEGPLEFIGGILNGVGTLFGGPDNYHHGRGFEISNALTRQRRPQGKPLLVFIDSNVDTRLLRKAGYVYVGGISLEGKVDRNWDQVYDAAVAETLPWDVDVLLVSGGMKGVTVGSNISFPGAGGAYSQANYSISLLGSVSSGITEGKGKAVINAVGYRFWPELARRREIPQSFYNSIRAQTVSQTQPLSGQPSTTLSQPSAPRQKYVPERQPVPIPETISAKEPLPVAPQTRAEPVHPERITSKPVKPTPVKVAPVKKPVVAPKPRPRPSKQKKFYGVQVSQRLIEMAGY